jgi:hypothetical protein
MTNELHCFYRISDAGNPLGRTELGGTYLASVTRRKCFNNFLDAFGIENLHVICDNCNDDTIEFIRSKGVRDVDVTSLGNTRSFMYLIDRATSELREGDIVYSCEDDYLHTSDARQYIFEGIRLGDYVSLYDSLDKYCNADEGGNNPLIYGGGEDTKVLLGQTIHFKKTNATTCTFASLVDTLREDYSIISKYNQPHFPHPYDFALFRELLDIRGRVLVNPIPGKSMHVGLEPSPFVPWENIVKNLKED